MLRAVWQRMAGEAGGQLDHLFVRAAFRSGPRRGRSKKAVDADVAAGFDEARRFYEAAATDGRLFPEPAAVKPLESPAKRRVGAGEVVDLSWPSGWRWLHESARDFFGRTPQNDQTAVRWYRHSEPAPAVICLHGWGGGCFPFEERMFRARWLFGRGLDVLLFTLPLHGRRGPGGLAMPRFPSPSPFRTNEGFAQAIYELRALLHLLRHRGAPVVGLCGMSLGGLTTALLATVDERLDFAVPIIPVASIVELIWYRGQRGHARKDVKARGMTLEGIRPAFAPTAPLSREPTIAPDRFVVVAGDHDNVIPADHPRRLQEHFNAAPIITFPGSHLLQVGKLRILRPIVAMAERRRSPSSSAGRERSAG